MLRWLSKPEFNYAAFGNFESYSSFSTIMKYRFMTSVEKTYTWSITLNFLCSVAGMSPYFQPFYQPNECGKALCVRPDVMELDELYEFPEYSRDPTMYLALRNLILALWNINCTVSLVWIMLLDFSWHPFHPSFYLPLMLFSLSSTFPSKFLQLYLLSDHSYPLVGFPHITPGQCEGGTGQSTWLLILLRQHTLMHYLSLSLISIGQTSGIYSPNNNSMSPAPCGMLTF